LDIYTVTIAISILVYIAVGNAAMLLIKFLQMLLSSFAATNA